MMENSVSIERVANGALRRRVGMGACPHCGGNVRAIRDIYGAYRQCLQCSREIKPGSMATGSHPINETMHTTHESEKLLAA